MSLEAKYNAAAAGTNAGQAKAIGTAASPSTNFFDGSARGQGNTAPDEFQQGFKPNAAGDYRYGGGGKVPGVYAGSTWLNKALDKAKDLFSNVAFNSIIKGDTRNAPNTTVHKFTPEAKFESAATLSEFAKSKAK